jgi:tetratricopeptide (TPR) repeat protein
VAELLDRLQRTLSGRYAIERELARGGMAIVYLARDLPRNRDVALKVLRPELVAQIGAERFLREIQIEASLQHPHILPLYDSGIADGLPFYTMPYVDGGTLRQRLLRETQLPLGEVVRITQQVATGLSYAHRHGFVHRDVKPENIMFEDGHALVADFGVARALTEAADDRLTESGVAVGTPPYMSPEQAAGSDRLDARSDVYSLGCVVYEMLCGDPPFTGPTPQAVMARQVSERPPSLSIVRPEIPKALEEVVEHALAKTPADRYQTPDEFSAGLADCAERPGALPRTVRRSRSRMVAAGMVAAAVVALVVWRALPGPYPVDPNTIVQYPLEVSGVAADPANADFQLGEDAAYLIVGALDGKASLTWIDGRDFLHERYLHPDSLRLLKHEEKTHLARVHGAGFYVDGRVVRLTLDSVRLLLELHDVGENLPVERADTAGLSTATASLGLLAMGKLLLSFLPEGQRLDVSDVAGRSPDAIQAFVQGERSYRSGKFMDAFQHFRSAVERDSEFTLAALKAAFAANMSDDLDEASALIEAALPRAAALAPRDAHMVRGFAAYVRGSADDALYHFRRAKALGPARPEVLMAIGQTLRHLLPLETSHDSMATAAFAEVHRVEEGFTPVLSYLVGAALRQGDLATAGRYLDQLRAAEPDPRILGPSELALRCISESPDAIEWQRHVLEDVDRVFQVARSLHIGAAHPPCALAAWRAVAAYDTSSRVSWRFSSLLGLQSLLAAMGRFTELNGQLDSVAASGTPTGRALADLSILYAVGGAPTYAPAAARAAELRDGFESLREFYLWFLGVWDAYGDRLAEARAIRDILATLQSNTESDAFDLTDFQAVRMRAGRGTRRRVDSLSREVSDVERQIENARRERNAALEDALRERQAELQLAIRAALERWRQGAHRRLNLFTPSLSAFIAVREGDSARAVRLLEALTPTSPRPNLTWRPWESLGLEWLMLAKLHFGQGDFEAALEVAARLEAPGSVANVMYLAESLKLRMRAAQAVGNEALAERMRRRLLELGRQDLVESTE